MTEKQEKFLRYREKALPIQLDRARRRYHALVREARRMKMHSLLTNKEMVEKEYD